MVYDFAIVGGGIIGLSTGLALTRRYPNARLVVLEKESGSVISPGFEINDAGILNSADEIEAQAKLTYRETRPGELFHRYELKMSNESKWDFGGVRLSTSPQAEAKVTWKNFWTSKLKLGLETRAQSHDLTRGGPLMGTWAGWSLSGGLSSSDASTTSWSVDAGYGNDELGGWDYGVGGGLFLRPGPRWEFSIAGIRALVDPRQFITSVDGGPATFGTRYIFSFVEQSELSAQIRMHYIFSPDLTLELYAEPFAASGRFYRFGELRAAGSRFLRPYGREGTTIAREADGSLTVTDGPETFTLDNEDFNVGSFRSNLVLRWEWHPGSTLFLIWQQDRSSFDPRGGLVGPGSLLDPLQESGDHVLALKIAYWIPVD